jgi:hypothetical protein
MDMDFSIDPGTLAIVGIVVVGLLVVYYIFLVRALVEMIRSGVTPVMIVFGYLSLIPVPPLLILGILSIIIWHCVRADMPARPDRPG